MDLVAGTQRAIWTKSGEEAAKTGRKQARNSRGSVDSMKKRTEQNIETKLDYSLTGLDPQSFDFVFDDMNLDNFTLDFDLSPKAFEFNLEPKDFEIYIEPLDLNFEQLEYKETLPSFDFEDYSLTGFDFQEQEFFNKNGRFAYKEQLQEERSKREQTERILAKNKNHKGGI